MKHDALNYRYWTAIGMVVAAAVLVLLPARPAPAWLHSDRLPAPMHEATPTATFAPPTRMPTPTSVPTPLPSPTPPLPAGAADPSLPPGNNAYVVPQIGPPGTEFRFEAAGFASRETVAVWLEGPDGKTLDMVDTPGSQVLADRNGSIARERLRVVTTPDFADGIWTFHALGLTSQHESYVYFRVSRDAAPVDTQATPRAIPPAGNGSRLGAMLHDTLPTQGDAFILPIVAPAGTAFTFTVEGFTPGESVGSWVIHPDGSITNVDPSLVVMDRAGRIEVTIGTDGFRNGAHAANAKGLLSETTAAAAFFITNDYFAGPGTPRPPQSNGVVTPEEGGVGTIFLMHGAGFLPNEQLELWTTEPDGVYTLFPEYARADEQGRIGVDPALNIQTTAEYLPGVYGVHFRGVTSNARADLYFTLTFVGGGYSSSSAAPAGTSVRSRLFRTQVAGWLSR